MNFGKDTNKKYTLYIRTGSELKALGKFSRKTELDTLIHSYLNSINYKMHYFRFNILTADNSLEIDYGSHTNFFVIQDLTIDEIECIINLFGYVPQSVFHNIRKNFPQIRK